MTQVNQQEETEIKICVSFSKGKGEVELYYTYDNFFDEKLPTKYDAIQLNRKIDQYIKDIDKMISSQEALQKSEKSQFDFNVKLDRKLIAVTTTEIMLIIFVFLLEFFVIKRYLNKRQLV